MYGVLLTDLAGGLVAVLLARLLRFGELTGGSGQYALLTLVLPLAWAGAIALHRGYDPRLLFVGGDEYQRLLRAGLSLTAAVAVASYSLDAEVARRYLIVAMPTMTGLGFLSRHLHRLALRRDWATGRNLRRVVVVGHECSVVEMARQLRSERYHGMNVVGACVPAPGPGAPAAPTRIDQIGLPVCGTFGGAAAAASRADADAVVVLAAPELDGPALRRLAWQLERHGIDLIVASAVIDVAVDRTTLRPVDGLPMLHVEHLRLTGLRRLVKEVVDRAGAGLLLLALGPLMLVVAALIRFGRDSPGPALFRQTRVGRDGTQFRIYKFRTMCRDAEARLSELRPLNEHDGTLFKLRRDPRVTRLGRWLRRYSVDELPQLINVVRGEMSLVGPRPQLPDEVARYPRDMRRRLVVKPGLTGLWQVSGRADLSWEETMRLDLRYVENWSLTLDLVILLRTVTAVVRSGGAY